MMIHFSVLSSPKLVSIPVVPPLLRSNTNEDSVSTMFNSIPLLVFVLVIFPAFMCSFVNSMRFDLKPDEPKCFSEELKTNALTVGKYSVVNPNEAYPIPDSQKITIRVRSPYGNNHHIEEYVDSGNFAFTAAEAGDYTACFSVPDHKSMLPVTIDFEWRSGVAAKDWEKIAKRRQINVMEFELKQLHDTLTLIHDEMFYLREREEEMQDLNRATDNKIFTLSFLSILLCFSVAGLQLWHLKTFFKRKKLL